METVTKSDIAKRVADQLKIEADQANHVLERSIAIIREELQRGNRVELPHLMTVEVEARQETAPPSRPLPLGARRLNLQFDRGLLDAVGARDKYHLLLCVPVADFSAKVISRQLESEATSVRIAEGLAQSLAAMSRYRPDLVVIDANLGGEGWRIIEEIKKRKDWSLTATLMIHGEGTDPHQVEGLRVTEDSQIQEPFSTEQLIGQVQAELRRVTAEKTFFQHEIHFRCQTRENVVEQANEFIVRLLEQAGMNEGCSAALAVAYREAIDNAARHGNKLSPRRFIDTIYLLDREKVTITVEDEGDGFDTEIYLSRGREGNAVKAARERNVQGRAGGLGIMLMLKCVDKLEYNYKGNLVKLTKYVRS